MEKFKHQLQRYSDYFQSLEFFVIIRQSLAGAAPLIIIGALALMIISLPIPTYQDVLSNFLDGRIYSIFNLIYNCSFSMLAIYMLIIISFKYATARNDDSKDNIVASLTAVAAFCVLNGDISSGTITSNFDSSQFFSAVFCAIIVCKIYFFIRSKETGITYLTINSDSEYGIALKSIFPTIVILSFFLAINGLITVIFNVKGFQGLFTMLMDNLFKGLGSSYFSMVLYTFFVHFLWFFGIHGNNVLEPIVSNFENVGEFIFSKSFYDIFISIGGSGTCLCLLIAIVFVAKSKEIRYISRLSAFPVLFNISEIISIGLPLLFNPVFLIPFLLVPLTCGTISYIATFLDLVPIIDTTVNWTTPIFFSGYYATGSYAGVILQFILIVIGTLIYIPFVKMYEDILQKEARSRVEKLIYYMEQCEKLKKEPDFLKMKDSLGQTARVLATDLSNALKDGDILYYYQPQVDMWGNCIGCEALIRWNHPVIGLVYPPLVIQLAKESGLLKKMDKKLIFDSCELIRDIETKYHHKVKISINLTVSSFNSYDVPKTLRTAINRYGISPAALWLEITETEVFTGNDTIIETLKTLQHKGHRLLIDDFGMGHTSLKYLQANRFDVVKLDGSLTKEIVNNEVNQRIIQSISELGNKLDFDIIAEYIEDEEQMEVLKYLGCHYFQGYLFSKPITKDEFMDFFKKNI